MGQHNAPKTIFEDLGVRSQESGIRSQESGERKKKLGERKKKSGVKLGLCIGFNLDFVSHKYATCYKIKNIN